MYFFRKTLFIHSLISKFGIPRFQMNLSHLFYSELSSSSSDLSALLLSAEPNSFLYRLEYWLLDIQKFFSFQATEREMEETEDVG